MLRSALRAGAGVSKALSLPPAALKLAKPLPAWKLSVQVRLGLRWVLVPAWVMALCKVGWGCLMSLAEGFLWDRQVSQAPACSTLLQSRGEQLPSLFPWGCVRPEQAWGSRGWLAQGWLGGRLWDNRHICAAGCRKAAGAAEDNIAAVSSPLRTLLSAQQVLGLSASLRFIYGSRDWQSWSFQACAAWSFLQSCCGCGDKHQ